VRTLVSEMDIAHNDRSAGKIEIKTKSVGARMCHNDSMIMILRYLSNWIEKSSISSFL